MVRLNTTFTAILAILACHIGAQSASGQGWYGVDPAPDGVYARPYRFIGTIYTFWRDGRVKQATGFLVGRSHVLTAGHVLYDQETRTAPHTVMFTPGEYYGRAPVGSANATKWAVAQPFLKGNKYYDYAVVRLNRPLGDRTLGWFAIEEWNQRLTYNGEVAGYTGLLNNAKSQFKATGNAYSSLDWDPRNQRGIHWSMTRVPPIGGLSGSPLFFNRNGSWRVVGIYTGGEAGGIGGVKLIREARTEIQAWINQNP